MSVSVIIPAAGKGERAGFSQNKLLEFIPTLGVPVLEKSVQAFLREDISEIIIAVSPTDKTAIENLLSAYPVKIVLGGKNRTQSVQNALSAVSGKIVLIHDGARPFVSQETITRCIEGVKNFGSAIASLPVSDTIAIGKDGQIDTVPDRSSLYALQTPQAFFTSDMVSAYAKIGEENFTDDSSVYAKFIGKPYLVEGNAENKKLTYACDFSSSAPTKIGLGIDTHAFGKAQDFIMLCGVKIPSDSGLIAHSDGDVAVHAVMDALLSSAGLPDIGHLFPDTSDDWKDADSMKMLSIVMGELAKKSVFPRSISIAIQAQKPRLAKYIQAMRQSIATALNVAIENVGITAGTNEGLGFVGEGKGITVTATVLCN